LETNNIKIIDAAAVIDALARVGDRIVAKANFVLGIKKSE